MSWPRSTDYIEAIQNLRSCMSDEELRKGRATINAMGLPMLWSGHFADVYKIECPETGNTWALKCFTREVAGLHERYREISNHLEQFKLPFTVKFQYLDQGIRIGRDWFPALKMRWIEGLALNQFVEDHANRPKMLGQLLSLWPKLARRMREARMAHADLQHGNVILVPMSRGRLALRLIDYDGMFVPALADRPSGELGHPAYQHPQRLREGTYSFEVDRFSHLAVYCAVRCLKVGRRKLWQQFNNGDNLLFREADFRNPGESELFRSLWGLSDADARSLVGRLALACEEPLDAVPLLDEVLVKGDGKILPLDPRQESAVKALLESKRKPKPPSVPALPVPPEPAGKGSKARSNVPALPAPPEPNAGKASGSRSEAVGTRGESAKPPPIEKTSSVPALPVSLEPISGESSIILAESSGIRVEVDGPPKEIPPVPPTPPTIFDSAIVPLPELDRVVPAPGLHDLWVFPPGLAKHFSRDSLLRALKTFRLLPQLLVAPVRIADKLLLNLVGPDNTILHNFLRLIVCVALVVGAAVVSQAYVGHWENYLFWKMASVFPTKDPAESENPEKGKEARRQESKEDDEKRDNPINSGISPPDAAPSDKMTEKQHKAGIRIARSSSDTLAKTPSSASTGSLKLLPIPPQVVEVQKPLTVPLRVENAKQWKGRLKFSLGSYHPPEASINPKNGVFSWTPNENSVGQHTVTASVVSSRDSQLDTVSFDILVTRQLPHRSIRLNADGKINLELVSIPAGSFLMGDNTGDWVEKPVHHVTITKEFEIGKYEVTQEQWQFVMGNNPSKDKGPRNPVERVSWDDCQLFLQKITEQYADKDKGERFCLPTEAQWEYACRAESNEKYCFGNSVEMLKRYAWYRMNLSERTTLSVGQKLPNIWGLYDMHGSVWEWCADWFACSGYEGSSQDDPLGLPPHSSDMNRRVLRGGGFDDFASECRAAHRDSRDADYPSFTTGFRVACIRGSAPASEGPLRLDNIGRKSIPAGKTLTFPVSVENANDWIGNLRFCLIDNPSDSARINSVTGEFTWQPDDFRENQTVTFTVFVSDAVGIQKDQQSFKVYVERPKNRPAQRIPPRIKRP